MGCRHGVSDEEWDSGIQMVVGSGCGGGSKQCFIFVCKCCNSSKTHKCPLVWKRVFITSMMMKMVCIYIHGRERLWCEQKRLKGDLGLVGLGLCPKQQRS